MFNGKNSQNDEFKSELSNGKNSIHKWRVQIIIINGENSAREWQVKSWLSTIKTSLKNDEVKSLL